MAGELLILYNAFFNMILLQFVKEITHVSLSRMRIIVSALCSAAVAVILPTSILTIALSFICLIGIAFSFRLPMLLLHGGWLLIGTLLVGGLLTALQPVLIGQSIWIYSLFCALFAVCILYAISRGWQKKLIHIAQQAYVTTCVMTLGSSKFHLQAYIDTGNECREPLSQAPVHFLSFQAVENQLSSEMRDALQAWQTSEPHNVSMFPNEFVKLIRFVPITTVHKQKIIVPAFRMNQFQVDEREYTGHYVVFTQNAAPFPQQVDMILHVCILMNK